MYLINSFAFFFIAGLMILVVRAELAQPGLQFVSDATYNQLFTMHATIMIFVLVIQVLALSGSYLVRFTTPAPSRALPRTTHVHS